MRADKLKGKAVISVASGTTLGKVEDVVFDLSDRRSAALRISSEGQEAYVPFDQVKSFGEDVITVPSDDVTRWVKPAEAGVAFVTADDIDKFRIVTTDGKDLGKARHVDLDPATGALLSIESREGGFLGVGAESYAVEVSAIVSIGDGTIVVQYSGEDDGRQEETANTEAAPTTPASS